MDSTQLLTVTAQPRFSVVKQFNETRIVMCPNIFKPKKVIGGYRIVFCDPTYHFKRRCYPILPLVIIVQFRTELFRTLSLRQFGFCSQCPKPFMDCHFRCPPAYLCHPFGTYILYPQCGHFFLSKEYFNTSLDSSLPLMVGAYPPQCEQTISATGFP